MEIHESDLSWTLAFLCQLCHVVKSCRLAPSVGSSEDQTTPMLVTALKGLKVVDVACGSGDAQTLAVTENGKNNEPGRLVFLQ